MGRKPAIESGKLQKSSSKTDVPTGSASAARDYPKVNISLTGIELRYDGCHVGDGLVAHIFSTQEAIRTIRPFPYRGRSPYCLRSHDMHSAMMQVDADANHYPSSLSLPITIAARFVRRLAAGDADACVWAC